MNWGNKIVVGLGAFVLFIVGSGIYMVTKDSDSLIDENYYEKSLAYDTVYEHKQNVLEDNAKPIIRVTKDSLHILFVGEGNTGTLTLKRPSDGKLDKSIPFKSEGSEFDYSTTDLTKGNWIVEIYWKRGNKDYWYSQPVFIQ